MIRKPFGDSRDGGLRERLRGAEPAVDAGLPRDLWPRMLKRIEEGSAGRNRPVRLWPAPVPWLDWALIGIVGATLAFFPALIPAILYHL
jgi:hypothetical protein